MAEPSILGALQDPQFRSDTLRNLVEALNGAKRSLTVGSLGAVGDMGNTLANLVRAGAGTAYHEATGRPIPQALEYRDPARDFGTSASLGNFAESQGWLPPQTFSMPEQAGALLGPIVAMKAPDLANSTLRGLVSALKSEPSRRMVEGYMDGIGARQYAAPKLDMADAARRQRAEEQGYRFGLWRGGKNVADGPYYTPDESAAYDFSRRHGPDADVREYALQQDAVFDTRRGWSAEDLAPIAAEVAKNNKALAKDLLELPGDWGGQIPGSALFQVLDRTTGDGQSILRGAGFKSIDAGQEVLVLDRGIVRDANRAAFDPKKKGKIDPFAGLAGAALGAGYLADRKNDDSVR